MIKQHTPTFQGTMVQYRNTHPVLHQPWISSFCLAEISSLYKSIFSKNTLLFVEEAGIEPAHMALQTTALPTELFFRLDHLMAMALCHQAIPLISSKLFLNITRQTESCLQPLTALRMRRRPFCLSLRVAADTGFEPASSDWKSDIFPIDESTVSTIKNPNLQQDGVFDTQIMNESKSQISSPVACK